MHTQNDDSDDFLKPRQPESRLFLAIGCILGLVALAAIILTWNRHSPDDADGKHVANLVDAIRPPSTTPRLDDATKTSWCERIRNTNPCCPGYPNTFKHPRMDTGNVNRDWCNRIGQKNVSCPGYMTWALSRQGMEESCRDFLDWCDRINNINIGCPFNE